MLVVFRSKATETLTMFEKDAVELLKLMGATGHIPGGLDAADVPGALARLESAIRSMKTDAGKNTHKDVPGNDVSRKDDVSGRLADLDDRASGEEKQDREPPVTMAMRAVPLIDLLKRAAAANAELVWEARK